jgi:HAD superfamily hydrolase (TIGR01484 family)
MKKIEVIVADIEGCITPPNRGMMNPSDFLPIVDYCKSAMSDKSLPPIVFCTGRQIPYVECVAQLTNAFFPNFPSVAENGAFLYDVALNDVFLNPAVTPEAKELLHDVRKTAEKILQKYDVRKEYGKDICISLNPPLNTSISDFFEIVCESFSQYSKVVNITHSASAVDITPIGIDKASGVRFLSEKTGILLENMLGIGDSRGDLPMLNIVGIPTGPANASREVKEIAEFISDSEGVTGVAEILKHFTSWQ